MYWPYLLDVNVLKFLICSSVGLSNPVDLLIAIDSTKGIPDAQFGQIKEFLKAHLASHNISTSRTNVAILSFGKDVKEILALRNGTSREIVEKRLDAISTNLEGPQSTTKPLAIARRILTSDARYRQMRASSQVLLVMTEDSSEEDGYRLKIILSHFDHDGIDVVFLAVGLKRPQVLRNIVQDKAEVIEISNVGKLREKLGELEKRIGESAGMLQ